LRAWRTHFITAAIEVGALGPYSLVFASPCLVSSAIASSSGSVDSHTWPDEVHESLTSMPWSGS
jgi:hypothetical protein